MNYLPEMKPAPVVKPGEFVFAATHFDHGHIHGQIRALISAGGVCRSVYDPSPERLKPVADLVAAGTRIASSFEEILDDPEIALVTSAAIPSDRAAIGLRVMESGKDYLTDKSPFTTLAQLEEIRAAIPRTGRKYMVCYSERLCNESAWQAGEFIREGAIGRVLQVLNLAPHNL
ncbi:MAG TPA: Gfo/Idh/MocA family oxidoreductase, partial [Terrimicrobiaceae bacterium]|nr:Gfo/Idh/MocA family oxidoreductase [Terrimicrobiaceae bacterium]